MDRLRGTLAASGTGIATAVVILAVSVAAFLNPWWIGLGQDRADAGALTGFAPEELRRVTGSILSDLVFGPPAFDVEIDGSPVLNEREREHMRDVRGVFAGFAALAAVAGLVVVAGFILARGRRWYWASVRAGAIGLVAAAVIAGVVALLAFDAAFALFHRLFFAEGSWTFDPVNERLVQLFPMTFWVETTVGVGILALLVAVATAWVAGRRADRAPSGAGAAHDAGGRPATSAVDR
jgi:integral membrane protein (TIGR01906 family)